MLDSLGELTLQQLCEKTNLVLPINGANRSPRFDAQDMLRTIYWFRGIQMASGIATAYGVGKRFESEAYKKSDGVHSNTNKWRRYAIGLNVPKQSLVARVERDLPGLQRQLNHPLWRALASKCSSLKAVEELVLELNPVALRLVRRYSDARARRTNYPSSDRKIFDSLERNAGLDALAAIALMLRRAHLTGRTDDAYELGRVLLRQFVILGEELMAHGVARPLLELVDLRLLVNAEHAGIRYAIPSYRYPAVIKYVRDIIDNLDDLDPTRLSLKQRRAYALDMLNARRGWDVCCALNPIRRAVKDHSLIPPDKLAGAIKDDRLWQWAWIWRSRLVRHPSYPPDEVFSGEDLSAIREEEFEHLFVRGGAE